MGFLDISNVTKSYGSVQVLHRVDIAVEEGEFLVLVGPSGCGKSTLLNMIAGLEGISGGEIRIKDRVMNGVHPSKRNIAMVFQSYALYPNMTVGQNMTFGLEMHGVPKPERYKALADVSKLLQIDHLLDRKPGQLSGGQRQRVAMGRALVRDPDVFLFDEPLSNLDAKLRVDMRTEIKKLHHKLKTTIVYVTHDQIEAMTLSTRIAVMNKGLVQQLGTPKEIYDTPANLFVATFMGSPAMNIIPAKVVLEGGAPQAQVTDAEGKPVLLALNQSNLTAWAGRDILLGIRPEAITDPEGADRNSASIRALSNVVTVTEPAGADTFVTMSLSGKDVIARMRADAAVHAGQRFDFAVNMEKAVAFDPETEERIALMDADILIIGSGMGGATLAASLAPSGRRIVILERGERLADSPEARDPDAIFRRAYFKPKEVWKDASGAEFEPGNYAFVGGNTKFYGAVLLRYRAEDFRPLRHIGGTTPGWPIGYDALEPFYTQAETLLRVRGDAAADDPTEPPHSAPYPFPPVPDEPDIAAMRRAFAAQGLHPTPLPIGIDIDAWLKRAPTAWDAFPCTTGAKSDAESCSLAEALKYPNVTLLTGTKATRLLATGRRVTGVEVDRNGRRETLSAPVVCLCAGAVMSSALLLASADADNPNGLANGSDQVGRNFMNHNLTGVVAWNPLRRNRTIYEKTIQFNDWYLTGGPEGEPLGNVQMLGRITGPILAGESGLPLWAAGHIADHSVHVLAMSEDLPDPNSRVLWREGVVLDWRRTNTRAHDLLVKRLKGALRRAGWPIVMARGFPKSKPSHQCGTARMGADPAASVVDANLKAHDLDNLYIVDASVLPTSAAVNPSLTIAALALRAGSHIGARP